MKKPGDPEYEILRYYKQTHFFNQCHNRFLKAREAAGEVKHFYGVGGTSVCLSFAGQIMVPLLSPALEHLRIPETRSPDLTLCIWDSESTSVEMAPPPCTVHSFTDRGDIWGFNSSRIKTAFHWIEASVNVMDLYTNTGVFWVKSAKMLPFWVHASPLRTLFHWWMEKNGCQLLHAAAVGTDDGAVLITGKGGVGKSTTALSCLESGLKYLADDYVIVRLEPEPVVYSLYSTAKLNAEDVMKFPSLARFVKNPEKLDREKAVMFLYPGLVNQIVEKLPLKAIFTPEVVNQTETKLHPTNYLTIQRALSFTTMSQLPNVGLHTHAYISKLAVSLPGFVVELGNNFSKIPAAVSKFLSGNIKFQVDNQASVPDTTNIQSRPLVSVIVPVFNGERFIKNAIDNILSQNYPALEIIIIDDGSTDNTKGIIDTLPADIRYFRQDNDGPASARNRGIKDVSGEFIAFLDVDDLWPENNLDLLIDEMIRDPEMQIIRGRAQLLEENRMTGRFEFTGDPKTSFPNYIGATLYRKAVFDKVGLFDPSLRYGEDNDWFNRAAELKINMKRIEEVTLYVRRHGKNMTEGKNLVELNKLRVFKKTLDRMRSQKNH